MQKLLAVFILSILSADGMAQIIETPMFNGKFKQNTVEGTIAWSGTHSEKNNILPVQMIIIQHPEPVIALTDGYNAKCTDGFLTYNKSVNITPEKIMLSSTGDRPFLGMQIRKDDWKLAEKTYDISVNACGVEYKLNSDEINALHYLQYYYPHDEQKYTE